MRSARPDLRIIRAEPYQAPLLTRIAVESKAHWNYPAAWMEEWSLLLVISPTQLARDEVFCAEVDGRIVGFYAIRELRNKGHLEHLWVLPQFIGQGIGRALFEHALEQARTRGLKAILVESDPNAAGFYLRMGARPLGTVTSEIAGEERELPCFAYDLV